MIESAPLSLLLRRCRLNNSSPGTLFKTFSWGAGALLAAFLYSSQLEPAAVEVVYQRIRLTHLKGGLRGLRLVQISDIHMGGWMNRARLERVVKKVLEQKPDVVAITGDFISGKRLAPWIFEDLSAALAPLPARVKTVAVLGNHDHRFGLKEMRRMLAEIGIYELRNRVLTLKLGEAQLHLAGVDDIWMEEDDLNGVLMKIPVEGPAILLAHEPDFADIAAESGRFDLQISGHTHGGQVFLPFLGRPALPALGTRYPCGLYRVGRMFQYTNRGVGMGSLPFRFNCPPEITVFILE